FFGRSEKRARSGAPSGVMDRPLCHELTQRGFCCLTSSHERRHSFLRLNHGRSSYHLVGGRTVYDEKICLNLFDVHRLGRSTSNNQILLIDQSSLDDFSFVSPATIALTRNIYTSLYVV